MTLTGVLNVVIFFQGEELSGMKSLQKDLEDALRRARGDADHFKKQLTEAHRVAMSQASVAASVAAAASGGGYLDGSRRSSPGAAASTISSQSDATSTSITQQSAVISSYVKAAGSAPGSYSVPPIDGKRALSNWCNIPLPPLPFFVTANSAIAN